MAEVATTEVEVERVGVAGEVGFDDIEHAVPVEVAYRDPHTGLGSAVGGVGYAGFDGDVFEGAVFLVLVEGGGGGVVGNVDVGPAVTIEVGHSDGEGVGADGVEDAGFRTDVGEGTVAVVAVEDVFAALQARRAAGDLDAFVGAAGGLGERGRLDVEVDVVGDEEVEVAVAVVVEEGAAGVPSGSDWVRPALAVTSVKVPLPLLR